MKRGPPAAARRLDRLKPAPIIQTIPQQVGSRANGTTGVCMEEIVLRGASEESKRLFKCRWFPLAILSARRQAEQHADSTPLP